MNYAIGDYLVYGTAGICSYDGTVKRSFDGIEEAEYCRLIPLASTGSVYYVPVSDIDNRVRALLSKDEVLALIDAIPETDAEWCSDKGERRNLFDKVIKSGDSRRIIGVLKALYERREERKSCGKKLSVPDEKAMKAAESLVLKEFSVVLGIDIDDLTEFIDKRLADKDIA